MPCLDRLLLGNYALQNRNVLVSDPQSFCNSMLFPHRRQSDRRFPEDRHTNQILHCTTLGAFEYQTLKLFPLKVSAEKLRINHI